MEWNGIVGCGLSHSVPYEAKSFALYGGDDGARTRDLCRDSLQPYGISTTYNTARATQARGSRLRHGNLWNKLWNGRIPKISGLRVPPLVPSTTGCFPHPFDVNRSIWIDFLRSVDSLGLRWQYSAGSFRAGATHCVITLVPALDVQLFLLSRHFYLLSPHRLRPRTDEFGPHHPGTLL